MTNSRAFKAVLFSLLFSGFGASIAKTIEINYPFVLASSSMEKVSLIHDEEGFHVLQNNEVYSVEKCWVDSSLQNISSEDLEEFLVTGHICVNQMDSGEFSLQAKNLIKGGGPGLAAAGYWLTKTLCYGTAVAAATTVVVATGGAAGAAGGVLAAAVTGGAGTAVTLTGAALAGGGLAVPAAEVTVAVISGSGGIASAIVAVESLSIGVFTILLALPTF